MCELTRVNFAGECDKVIGKIRECTFVAFDTEFTALRVDDVAETSSLFDSGDQRYAKLRENAARGAIINQVGLAIFTRSGEDTYVCDVLTFYVCPRSHVGGHDPAFALKSSSVEFLANHGFDFNKFLRDGIPYLNDKQERDLISQIENGSIFQGVERRAMSLDDLDLIRDKARQVSDWLNACGAEPRKEGDSTRVSLGHNPSTLFLFQTSVRSTHPRLWTSVEDGEVTVTVVSPERRKALEDKDDLQDELVEANLGFTRVYRALVRSGKPVVGHNCFTDLVKMIHQFGPELPSSYLGFKKLAISQFPAGVYDTKFICFELKKRLDDTNSKLSDQFASTKLQDLMANLDPKTSAGFGNLPFAPKIVLGRESQRFETEGAAHDAGYDAYMTGYAFLKAAHYSAGFEYKSPRPLNFKEHLHCLRRYRNRLNVARAAVMSIDLDGKVDPKAVRPAEIYVTKSTLRQAQSLTSNEEFQNLIAHKLSRFGSVDVRLLSRNEAIVAVGNHRTARDILLAFTDDEDLLATNYSAHKRQQILKYTLGFCSTTAVLVSVCALVISRFR